MVHDPFAVPAAIVTIMPFDYRQKYRLTKHAIRAGAQPWLLSDESASNAGYLTAATFNRIQNTLSTAIATPFILLGSISAPIINQQLGASFSSAECDVGWLGSLPSLLLPFAISILAPYAIARTVLLLSGTSAHLSEMSLRAYKYQNGAHTFLGKTLFLMAYGLFLSLVSLIFLIAAFVDKTGGAMPGSEGDSGIFWFFMFLEWGPALAAAILLPVPVYLYARFLLRFAGTMHGDLASADGESRRRRHPGAWFTALVAILLSATLFFLTVAAPAAADLAVALFQCEHLLYRGLL